VSLWDIAVKLDELGIAWTTSEHTRDGHLLYLIGGEELTPAEVVGKCERGELAAKPQVARPDRANVARSDRDGRDRPRTRGPYVSLSDIAALLGKERTYAQWLMERTGAPPGTQTSAGKIRWRSDVEAYIRDRLPKGWAPPPDVVAHGDVSQMLAVARDMDGHGVYDRFRAKWVMNREVHPDAPEGTQSAAGMIWDRPVVEAFLEAWKPQKGPQATCDRNHPMKESPSGRRYCPTCDVRRHKEKRERDRAGSGPATSDSTESGKS
jgi:hypothetical protein